MIPVVVKPYKKTPITFKSAHWNLKSSIVIKYYFYLLHNTIFTVIWEREKVTSLWLC